MTITVTRKNKTQDGLFGIMTLDWSSFRCVTMENLQKELAVGTWPLTFAYSPHFNRRMPLVNVPHRTWTWIHWANWPMQLEGCIAVGEKKDGDAIDHSVGTWNKLWDIINLQMGIMVKIVEDFGT